MKPNLLTKFNSRQFMKAEEFELFYFNDNSQMHVSPHFHDYYELYFFIKGTVDYKIDGKSYPLCYGDYLLIPPHKSHQPVFRDPNEPYQRFVLWISTSYFQKLNLISQNFTYSFQYVEEKGNYHFHADNSTFQNLQGRLLQIIEETKDNKFCHELESQVQLSSLLIYINRLIYDLEHQISPNLEKELYLNICNYLTDHLKEDLSLDQLAAVFYVSKYHISHIFKDHMGVSVHQYITKKRLQAVKNAILAGVLVSSACQQYGFNDYTSFYRAFKKEFGISPKEFKNNHQLPT